MEVPKTLKDLRWFLIKDLELYNKSKPKQKRSLWDLVAFDVETSYGTCTIVSSAWGIIFYFNEHVIFRKACGLCGRKLINYENLPLPIDFDAPILSKDFPYHHTTEENDTNIALSDFMVQMDLHEF